MKSLKESFAKYFSMEIAKRVRAAQAARCAQGPFPGKAPFGYKNRRGKLVINRKTAPAVAYVFKRSAKSTHPRLITDALWRRVHRGGRQ